MYHHQILLDCCWKCWKSNSVFGNREYLEQNMAGSASISAERRLWISLVSSCCCSKDCCRFMFDSMHMCSLI